MISMEESWGTISGYIDFKAILDIQSDTGREFEAPGTDIRVWNKEKRVRNKDASNVRLPSRYDIVRPITMMGQSRLGLRAEESGATQREGEASVEAGSGRAGGDDGGRKQKAFQTPTAAGDAINSAHGPFSL
jgi:hypothetical protein